MAKIKKILCVIDPTTDTQTALERAVWLSKWTGASLDLLACCYNEYFTSTWLLDAKSLAKIRREAMRAHKGMLGSLAAPLRAEGLDVETIAIWDHPLSDGIIRQAHTLNSDIVVKDTHHHATLVRSIFSNTDWNLIRTCPVPLWLVKPGAAQKEPRFIAALDPLNEHDKPAALDGYILQLSKSLADDVGGDVHAFHAYETRTLTASTADGAYASTYVSTTDIDSMVRNALKTKFDAVTEEYGVPTDHSHLINGFVREELPALAEELHALVVVMGAVSRNRMQRIFIGATAERTLEHLPCDLLVVKPPWFDSPVDMHVSDAA